MIVGEIDENDKVRSVYGGSVEQAACRNLARSCAPKPGRVPKPGRRSHAEARPGRVRRTLAAGRVPKSGRAPVTARRGPAARRGAVRSGRAWRGQARPGPTLPSARLGRRRERDGKDGLDDGRDDGSGPVRPHGEVRSGPAGPSAARPGPARPGPARPSARLSRRRERDGKDGLDDGRDHLCM